MQPAQAIGEIERCSGTQFDPRIVDTLGHVLFEVVLDRVS
jgi:HD-GYP domain-containing protein (c-di-GMP phosphodiesterase class II)